MHVAPRETGLIDEFRNRLPGAAEPLVVRAPGRVNLLGGHTDYNEGFVLPVAVDRYLYVVASPRQVPGFRVWSTALGEEARFSVVGNGSAPVSPWARHVWGMARELANCGKGPAGADLMLWGDLPVGGGLSSSAAVEVGVGWALLLLEGRRPDPVHVAKLGQHVEHTYAGVRCGIMDQMIVAMAQESTAMLLDCRSLQSEFVPVGALAIVICDSGKKRELAVSAYNQRRRECENAVSRLAKSWPSIRSLRDVTPSDLDEVATLLPPTLVRRVRHVVEETARVVEASEMLRTADAVRFGRLVSESHRSLRYLYEVSCQELDLLVGIAAKVPGVLGCRLTGAGFGGAVVAVAQPEGAGELAEEVNRKYHQLTGLAPTVYLCRATGGVRQIPLQAALREWTRVGRLPQASTAGGGPPTVLQ